MIQGEGVATDAHRRTWKADTKLDAVIDVRAYGAVGDGVTDDTAAIQAAIDAVRGLGGAVPATGTGGVVEFPVALYKVGRLVLEDCQTVTLRGTGTCVSNEKPYGTILRAAGTQDCILDVNGECSDIHIENMTLDANTVARTCIRISGESGDQNSWNSIQNCRFQGNRTNGYYIDVNSLGAMGPEIAIWHISDCCFYLNPARPSTSLNVYNIGGGGWRIDRCQFFGAAAKKAVSLWGSDFWMSDCEFDNNGADANDIQLYAGTRLVVTRTRSFSNAVFVRMDASGPGSKAAYPGGLYVSDCTHRTYWGTANGVSIAADNNDPLVVRNFYPRYRIDVTGSPSPYDIQDPTFTPGALLSAKANLINTVYNIVEPNKVMAFWLFDATGAATTVTDRCTVGGNTANTATLRNHSLSAIAASTCQPDVAGLAPNMTMDATHVWDVADAASLSFTEPNQFSVVVLCYPTNATSPYFLVGKADDTTGNKQMEWELAHVNYAGAGMLRFVTWNNLGDTKGQGRTTNAGVWTANAWHTVIGTYTGVAGAANFKVYLDGTASDTTSMSSDYTAMGKGTAKVASYELDINAEVANTALCRYAAVILMRHTLTAVEASRITIVLQAYAGQSF